MESQPEENTVTRRPTMPATSLHGMIRKHPRVRLWVHPAAWTQEHFGVFNCQVTARDLPAECNVVPEWFTSKLTASSTSPAASDSSASPASTVSATSSPSASDDSEETKKLNPWFMAAWFVRQMTAGSDRAVYSADVSDLFLRVGNRLIKLLCSGLGTDDQMVGGDNGYWHFHVDTSVAFIDSHRTSLRRKSMQVSVKRPARRGSIAKNRDNVPFERIRALRLARLTPPPGAHDPYIMAIMIALAQQRRRFASMFYGEDTLLETYKVAVVWSVDAKMRLYRGMVPGSLLLKFDDPAQVSETSPFDIFYDEIPDDKPPRWVIWACMQAVEE